eukprot:TRINITY_DN67073_c10_g2_i1.p1 TRINITY_DN67073_c10_g2~~TRINITY_DN67073_c10_g2_i1.p1  ORF type:complete len:311 (-),score=29.82 TRINITY_DN67073_c10_g2_i1:1485-2417(-)
MGLCCCRSGERDPLVRGAKDSDASSTASAVSNRSPSPSFTLSLSGDQLGLAHLCRNHADTLTVEKVDAYLAHGYNLNLQTDSLGLSLLGTACYYNKPAVVARLLKETTIDPDKREKDDLTPLMWSAKKGHAEVSELLATDSRTNLEQHDRHGKTALHFAAQHGHQEIVKMLVEQGADLTKQESEKKYSVLHLAVEGSHTEVVKYLLTVLQDSTITATTAHGGTALHLAAYFGCEEIVALLCSDGHIDVSAKDRVGSSCLSIAAKNGHTAVVERLKKEYTNKGITWSEEEVQTPEMDQLQAGLDALREGAE